MIVLRIWTVHILDTIGKRKWGVQHFSEDENANCIFHFSEVEDTSDIFLMLHWKKKMIVTLVTYLWELQNWEQNILLLSVLEVMPMFLWIPL